MPDNSLLILAGRIVCPATGLDQPGAVLIQADRIVATGNLTADPDLQILDFPDAILLPGLIDLHAHPARSNSQFGIDPDQHLLARGTTTVLSQGDAGSLGCAQFVRDTIETSQTHVILAINVSASGETGPRGCCEDLAAVDVASCIAAIERFRAHIWGIAVNASHNCCGPTDPREVLRRALQVANQTGLPLLYGLRRPADWPLAEQLHQLRPGDVVTYCFRQSPHCIVSDGRILPEIAAARARGIRFDVGHGCGSFSFATAETAIRDGFFPDTISTDLQRGHIDQSPAHDLPLVMSKLRAAGLPESDIFHAVTARPAEILRQSAEIGTLSPGSRADLTLLTWSADPVPLQDVHGITRTSGRWQTTATIRAGRLVAGP